MYLFELIGFEAYEKPDDGSRAASGRDSSVPPSRRTASFLDVVA